STSDGEYETSGFGATNLKVSYEPKDGLKFDIGVNNIFDKYYEFSEGYGEDGRTFFLNARYDF
ncbi:MAG: TonB-dependent receptor, partial [Campylobacteraceae bacterium]|nr:TonB-dependent receptor [Campylobacteraceae bacterium]